MPHSTGATRKALQAGEIKPYASEQSILKLYPLYLFLAFMTVLSPGPGVVMSLTNSLRYGMRGTFGGILGIAFGALVLAAILSTSLGVFLATSALAFTFLKFIGATYLVYLGVKLWRSPAFHLVNRPTHSASFGKRFLEGVSLQLTNPKAILFFLAVLPQFIDSAENYVVQFSVLVLSYSLLVVLVHTIYAMGAGRAKLWLTSARGGKTIRRVGGASFVFFGVALATAKP